ncbi:uncharacterized protein Dwil_GK17169 [Drosophila willistoni]|uniref:Carbohydrate kinase PfkB domain-containing protein n=1 Tax=Drosophila willistoni TaxID=7260 RepID=B4MKN4_DROWI|nr:uncharacterized protein Dwil_GK17169 [Drosophila willistoni]
MIDFVTVIQKFPEEDERERCIKTSWQRGGHASNICTVLRLLGAPVNFFGMLSRSSAFHLMQEDLQKRGIGIDNCPKTDADPAFSTIILTSDSSTRSIITCDKGFPYIRPEHFKQIDLRRFGWIHFEAYDTKQTMRMIRTVLEYNSGRDLKDRIIISLMVDKEYEKNIDLFDMCNYVIFSNQLANEIGCKSPEETCFKLDEILPIPRYIHVNRPCFICPWNSLGAGCIDTDGNYSELPAYKPKKFVDSFGVGDCFNAAFIYSIYVRKRSLRDAVDFSNMVASHKITSFGYEHIANFKVCPKKEIAVIDTGSQSDDPDEDGLTNEQRICIKYLNRVIKKPDNLLLVIRDAPSRVSVKEEPLPTSEPSEMQLNRFRKPARDSGSSSIIRYGKITVVRSQDEQ